MAFYECVYLSHLSGSWALRVFAVFHKLDHKELINILTNLQSTHRAIKIILNIGFLIIHELHLIISLL